MKINMRPKVTPLTMGLIIVGLIVAGVVAAYITKTQILKGTARLIIENSGGETSGVEIKFYEDPETISEINIEDYIVDFGDIEVGKENTTTVTIKNTGSATVRITAGGDCSLRDEWGGSNRIISEEETSADTFEANIGLFYNHGVYFPTFQCIWGSERVPPTFSDFITLKPGEEKEITLFVEFFDQETTGKSSIDVDFEYKFKLLVEETS